MQYKVDKSYRNILVCISLLGLDSLQEIVDPCERTTNLSGAFQQENSWQLKITWASGTPPSHFQTQVFSTQKTKHDQVTCSTSRGSVIAVHHHLYNSGSRSQHSSQIDLCSCDLLSVLPPLGSTHSSLAWYYNYLCSSRFTDINSLFHTLSLL